MLVAHELPYTSPPFHFSILFEFHFRACLASCELLRPRSFDREQREEAGREGEREREIERQREKEKEKKRKKKGGGGGA